MFRLCLAFFAAALVVSHTKAEENWPEFRGSHGDGHSDATGLPLTWSETENIRWKTPIHGKAWSSPVIWGQQVWLTTASEDGKHLFAVCVDRDSGAVTRDLEVFSIEKPQFCIPYNSYASSTPVIEEGRVYVHFGARERLAWIRPPARPCGLGRICLAITFAGPARRRSCSATC